VVQELLAASTRGEPYHFLFLDAHVPGLDEREVCAQIKSQTGPELSALVVIILAKAPACVVQASEPTDKQAERRLIRPVKPSELFNAVVAAMPVPASLPEGAIPVREGPVAPVPTLPPGLRVLLAEDNAINQKLAVRLLEKQGCQVRVVATGKAAVEAVCEENFDVVLMDVHMPEMDGLEATTLIRQFEARTGRERAPIVATTANAMKGDDAVCLESGMDGYVAKPMQARQLIEVINSVLVEKRRPAG
jgi:CheY-like chemotaxis protein